MNKYLFTTLLLVLSVTALAQAPFEAGYFIDNEGQRVECLIKNTDKKHNPTKLEYKLSESANPKIAALTSVKEFEIYNTIHKYKRFTVLIDRSGTNVEELSFSREPIFMKKELFLRTMVEGAASLFSYNEGRGLERFFYKLQDDSVTQLVYKHYFVKGNKIARNETYKQQIFDNLNCQKLSLSQLNQITYTGKSLVELFIANNECLGSDFINYYKRKSKSEVRLRLKAGAIMLTTNVDQHVVVTRGTGKERESKSFSYNHQFDKKTSPLVGLELELSLPFDQKKWSIFIEPAYQRIEHTFGLLIYRDAGFYDFRRTSDEGTFKVNYSRIAVPLGIRHSLYNGENSKLFIKGAVAFNFLIKPASALEVDNQPVQYNNQEAEFIAEPGITAGFGYEFKRLSIETSFLFSSATEIKGKYNNFWSAGFHYPVSIALGYRVF